MNTTVNSHQATFLEAQAQAQAQALAQAQSQAQALAQAQSQAQSLAQVQAQAQVQALALAQAQAQVQALALAQAQTTNITSVQSMDSIPTIQEKQPNIVDTEQNQFMSSSSNIQQKIQDLKRIHHLQQMHQGQVQVQGNGYGQQVDLNKRDLNIERMLQSQSQSQSQSEQFLFAGRQVGPMLSKIKLINGDCVDELRENIREFNQKIGLSLEKIEKINIDEFKDSFNVVFEKLSKYNDSIDTWYDDKYTLDKNKFYESIEEDEKKLFSFEKMDFISIGCAD